MVFYDVCPSWLVHLPGSTFAPGNLFATQQQGEPVKMLKWHVSLLLKTSLVSYAAQATARILMLATTYVIWPLVSLWPHLLSFPLFMWLQPLQPLCSFLYMPSMFLSWDPGGCPFALNTLLPNNQHDSLYISSSLPEAHFSSVSFFQLSILTKQPKISNSTLSPTRSTLLSKFISLSYSYYLQQCTHLLLYCLLSEFVCLMNKRMKDISWCSICKYPAVVWF